MNSYYCEHLVVILFSAIMIQDEKIKTLFYKIVDMKHFLNERMRCLHCIAAPKPVLNARYVVM